MTKDGTMRMGLPPQHLLDDYPDRAAVIGKLGNVSHVICSPKGELFCVRGGDLYRGTMPSQEGVDWCSSARRVGKVEWSKFKILFFNPNGDLYGITNSGELYKGPQPDNENMPWMYERTTVLISPGEKLFIHLIPTGRNGCCATFFDPCGVLYAVTQEGKLVSGKPPTPGQDCEDWLRTSTVIAEGGWLKEIRFMSFSPDGNLWSVEKNGDIYRRTVSDERKALENAEKMGWNYQIFQFLSFTQDKTVSYILSFKFLPDQGKIVSDSLEVIEDRIYQNKSCAALSNKFTFGKTVKQSSSFSHDQGLTFEAGAELTFTSGILFIAEDETTVKISVTTTNNWNLTKTNETEVSDLFIFSSSSEVELSPGEAVRVVALVVKAKLAVPYKARGRESGPSMALRQKLTECGTEAHFII
ncbi:hypothetical protein PRIEUP_LOCUS16273 [Pristimantis euphronides]